MMGKYDPPNGEEYTGFSMMERMYLRLANELAESNRLKILELKAKYLNSDATPFDPNELKDKA